MTRVIDPVSETSSLPGIARLARWSIAHRWMVVASWVILAVAGGLAAARSGSRLSFAFDLPGQPAYQTNTAIARTFGSGGNEPPLVAAVRLPRGTTVQSPGVREQLARAFGKAAAALPDARTASWVSTGDRAFVSADGRTTFELIYPAASLAGSDPPRHGAALPGRGRTRPASSGIHGWHTQAIGEACLDVTLPGPDGHDLPRDRLRQVRVRNPASRGLRCRVPHHDRGLAPSGPAG